MEVLSDAPCLRQNDLAHDPPVALVTQDKCKIGLVFQNAQTLFGRVSQKDRGTAVVEGLFEQRVGVRIGRDEQYDRRMHMVLASPRTTIRMLKQSASFVLTSLRGSTYRSVRLASSLAEDLLDGLFEHPATYYWKQPTPLPAKRKGGYL
jgi:hypothetical protein